MTGAPRLILLAAGGTGGHMFPAEATARTLLARGHRVLLVTDRRGAAHTEKFAGSAVRTIAAGGISGRSVLQRVAATFRLGIGFLEARSCISSMKPDAVLGFGGYAALPTMAAAVLARLPTALHEQNAILGRANRLLAPYVRSIATSFEDTAAVRQTDRVKIVVTGNPVRADIAVLATQPPFAFKADGPFKLLVTGGSQGARVFAHIVPAAIAQLPQSLRGRIAVGQQARPEDVESVRAAYSACGVAADIQPFFDDMPARLAACHLAICRAGASTCAELMASGRPAILVPYPHAIDGHQLANAQAIDAAGGAWLIPERHFDAAKLASRLEALITLPEALAAAARAAQAVARIDAAERLASLAERLLPANGNPQPMKVAAE
ncbi:MAG TPA: undecaprenyldiphospho-muramoylpentapeptide beta-N-acetylglucosaminyltransferase [Alphaproteobacteria bacterium]|nr:undecaprenyldiphospho-muramoylpentapeptide beta-N-acetylglucosaminyltransferase [Alphaproteobacteria bacterium]